MTKNALQVVQAFQESLSAGNSDWKELLTDDVTFKGPDNTVVGKEDNIKLNLEWAEMVNSYDPINLFGGETHVSMEGTYHVTSPTGQKIQIDTAEVYEVENEKISRIRVYYDGEEFRKAFAVSA